MKFLQRIKSIFTGYDGSSDDESDVADVRSSKQQVSEKRAAVQLANFESAKREINDWILGRKVDAGAITAEELEYIEKASHACDVVNHVIDDVKEITKLIAEAVNVPQIAELINANQGEKFDKIVLRDLNNAVGVSKAAAIYLLQVKNRLIDAKLKLMSTGWLSDRPPEIEEIVGVNDASNQLLKRKEQLHTVSTPRSSVELKQKAATTNADEVDGMIDECMSAQPETCEEAGDILRVVSNRRKKLQKRMKRSTNSSDDESRTGMRQDAIKLDILRTRILELTELKDALPSSGGGHHV